VHEQHTQLLAKDSYVRDLEDYIDDLLVKVMESHPKILQNPYIRPQSHRNNNSVGNNSAAVCGLPASATLPPGVYVANQLNKSTTDSDVTTSKNSKIKSRKAKGNRIELRHIFPKLS